MNKWILRLLAGVAVTGAAGSAVASQNPSTSSDEEAWERTVSTNTLEAYAKFSMEFPQSQYARKARMKLTVLVSSEADEEEEAPTAEPAKTGEPEFVPNSLLVV
jgi:hypothetical protein